MTTRKFQVGDRVRPMRRTPAISAHPWLKTGRVLTIIEVIPCSHGYHCWYRTASRRGRPQPLFRSDELRRQDERYRQPNGYQKGARD